MKVSTLPRWLRFGVIALASAAFVLGAGVALEMRMESSTSPTQAASPNAALPLTHGNVTAPNRATSIASPPAITVEPTSPPPSTPPAPTVTPRPEIKTLYGHLPYTEDDPDRLQPVGQFVRGGYSRPESLDLEAVQAFQQMAIAAKSAGVTLMPISGFRSIADQKMLFARQIERRGSAAAAAKLSAPPGHSEHHTGYAIDIADAKQPDTDLKYTFAETRAYGWLVANASTFGFEQSFPQQNRQGVSFEPWHWRYVGTPRAAEIFAVARSLY